MLMHMNQHWLDNRSLLWRHNDRHGFSNHQTHDCLLSRLFRRRSKKTSRLRVTGLCAGNSSMTGEFPAQMFPFDDTIMGIIKIGSRSKHHQPVVHFCNGLHTECQPCAGNSTHFDCEQLCLIQSKFYDVENSAPLVGLEPTTARLHDERSDLWATKMWHFPIHGLLALAI